ncbi:hypothetical protein [Pseudactinotalea sp. Z1732]|uniref:hypothetical protein n=1 Tax=Micrococcales TaxID=85006 RepID=UPI003C7ED23E
MSVTIDRHTRLTPEEAWAALTDFAGHGAVMPFTYVLCEPGAPNSPRAGWRFIARTRLGPYLLEDPMRITHWEPPRAGRGGEFHVRKVGRVLAGYSVVQVRPTATGAATATTTATATGTTTGTGTGTGTGTTITWRQHLRLRVPLPPPGPRISDAITRWLYGRAIDTLLAAHQGR